MKLHPKLALYFTLVKFNGIFLYKLVPIVIILYHLVLVLRSCFSLNNYFSLPVVFSSDIFKGSCPCLSILVVFWLHKSLSFMVF